MDAGFATGASGLTNATGSVVPEQAVATTKSAAARAPMTGGVNAGHRYVVLIEITVGGECTERP